jgi:hypothetical protein
MHRNSDSIKLPGFLLAMGSTSGRAAIALLVGGILQLAERTAAITPSAEPETRA